MSSRRSEKKRGKYWHAPRVLDGLELLEDGLDGVALLLPLLRVPHLRHLLRNRERVAALLPQRRPRRRPQRLLLARPFLRRRHASVLRSRRRRRKRHRTATAVAVVAALRGLLFRRRVERPEGHGSRQGRGERSFARPSARPRRPQARRPQAADRREYQL